MNDILDVKRNYVAQIVNRENGSRSARMIYMGKSLRDVIHQIGLCWWTSDIEIFEYGLSSENPSVAFRESLAWEVDGEPYLVERFGGNLD